MIHQLHRITRPTGGLLALLALAACVTINVYFPSAVAEQVADKFVQEVYGERSQAPSGAPVENPDVEPQSSAPAAPPLWLLALERLIPAAQAAPDFDADTPAIRKLRESMRQRHAQLQPFYASGAIGIAANGLLAVRELSLVPLPSRNLLRKLVADENADRSALYREIATANKQPEWEAQVRDVFAARWIANAPAGWYYQGEGGEWSQK